MGGVGFLGGPRWGCGDFGEMEGGMAVLGWCFCEWEVESRKRGRMLGGSGRVSPCPGSWMCTVLDSLRRVCQDQLSSHTAHLLSCSWVR